jgi:hypothetical protein
VEKNLVPPLRSALEPKQEYDLTTGFKDGDLLHLLDEPQHRTVLPVLGQCCCYDAAGNLWRLLAYVPASSHNCTTYMGRQARRFPEAGQVERWFGGIPLGCFTEVDITDSAEALALERCTEAIVIQLYPREAHKAAA